MGMMRWEKELAQAAEQERLRVEFEGKRREFIVASAEINARIETLRRELAGREIEMEALNAEQRMLEKVSLDREMKLRRRRSPEEKSAIPAPSKQDNTIEPPAQGETSKEK